MANQQQPVARDYKGITNVTGRVRGHANGLINFGVAAPARTGAGRSRTQTEANDKEMAESVKILAEAVNMLDGKSNDSAEGSNAPAGTVKKVRGLANVTGNVRGVGNGGVNFGDILYENVPEEDAPVNVPEGDVPVNVPVKDVSVKNG